MLGYTPVIKEPTSLIRGLHNLRPEHRGSVVTIGSFDGVHLGHQAIIQQVRAKALELNLPSVAMIFEPQPHEYFDGTKAPARLMRFREKIQALFDAGIDRVLCLPFNVSLRSLSGAEFIDQILVKGLGARYLVVGDDFHFGCDRTGDYQFLKAAGETHGFDVTDTHTYEIDAQRVSSTRIRAELEAGDFAKAAQLLGNAYAISGRVVYGQQLGRQLGVPTANVLLRRYRSPLSGVFAVKARLSDDRCVEGVANVGVRPTVNGGSKPILEVHLFEFDQNIYGQMISVEFFHKLREEQKFESLDRLKMQIHADIVDAKDYFNPAKN